MAKQKWRNRSLERGVVIDRARGYVYVRSKRQGIVRKELIGRTSEIDAIDRANARARHLRNTRRRLDSHLEPREQRLLLEDAADLFMRLHGERRDSKKSRLDFRRYVHLMKRAWRGRYIDSIVNDDMQNYRETRRRDGVKESTINREHTAVITMFNKLVEWRRAGHIPRGTVLPEGNPGRGARKVNEDRFVRTRLMTDAEYQAIWAAADDRLRRILLAVMNLPLRLADLKRLSKSAIHHKLGQFRGIQAKTGKEYILPINKPLWELIRTATGDLILDFTGFVKRWKHALRSAGLHPIGQRPSLQFRDLRRTAATALHDQGVPLRTISAMLGHQALTTTIRYLGLREENLAHAGEVLAARYPALTLEPSDPVKSVPKSVPTRWENSGQKASDSDRNINDFGGVAQLVRAAPS